MSVDLNAGDIFEQKFRITSRLGEGGFAVVYEAVDVALGRSVALKLFRPNTRDVERSQARFLREIQAVARLKDPHTVTMYEYGTSGDQLFVVFELIRGRDLAEILQADGPLTPQVAEHILRQLLSSLREAHHAGIIHRDIKPENVRVFESIGDSWRVKLLDFGIALPSDAPADLTAPGELIGTPRYMSPEQLTLKPLTPASDIYSLGMVFFEMLVGSAALPGGSIGAQLERLQRGHVFTAAILDQIGDVNRKLVSGMTALNPDDRLSSAEAVLALLDHAEHGETNALIAVPGEQAPKVEKPRPRATLSLVAVALSGLAVVAVLGALLLYLGTAAKPEHSPVSTRAVSIVRTEEPPDSVPPPQTIATDAPVEHGSEGCTREPPFLGDGTLRRPVGLADEQTPAYIPRTYDPGRPYPVVMLLHEDQFPARTFLEIGGFMELAEQHGFLVIAPNDGALKTWRDGADRVRLREILEETAHQLCVDRDRVFVVAQGSAGRTGVYLTCEDWVAGLAFNSYRRDLPYRTCGGPKPFIDLSALDSDNAPVEGGRNCKGVATLSIDEVRAFWHQRNGCHGKREQVWNNDNGACFSWECDTPFQMCEFRGGYPWPGWKARTFDFQNCDGVAPDFPTAERAWAFFSAIPRDAR